MRIADRPQFVLLAATALVGCTTAQEISKVHPHAKTLLISCTATWPSYLYGSPRERGYMVFSRTIKGYDGRGHVTSVSEPAMTLPPGTVFTGTRLEFESTSGTGPAIWIVGVARTPDGADVRVRNVVDIVAIDRDEWRKEHPFRILPPASEYASRSTETEPPWCESPDTPWKGPGRH